MKELSREQLERMSPERRQQYLKKVKAVKRNRKLLSLFLILVVAVAAGAIISTTVLFNISSIKATKHGKFYTEQEIISASGLNNGENILRTDFDSAEARIEKMLPYVYEATIDKSLSGAVTITIKDNAAAIIYEVKNGFAVADKQGKVLEVLKEEPENNTLRVLKTAKELKANPGDTIGFADEDEQKLYNTLCEALSKSGLLDNITAIDISNTSDIRVVYQNRLRIKTGNITQISEKLTAAAKVIASEDESNPNTIAEINATILKKVYVNPLDSLEEDETTVLTEENTEAPEENSDVETTEETKETGENEEKTGGITEKSTTNA